MRSRAADAMLLHVASSKGQEAGRRGGGESRPHPHHFAAVHGWAVLRGEGGGPPGNGVVTPWCGQPQELFLSERKQGEEIPPSLCVFTLV